MNKAIHTKVNCKAHPWQWVGFCGLFIFIASTVSAQPPLFEPQEGYYKAKGTRVTATWTVDRDTLPEDDVLHATLTIRGATNPKDIVRPDLGKLKQFKDQFRSIEDVGDSDANEVRFTYRLRPRDRSTNRLPSLDFFYLKPGGGEKPFENARAKGIDLTVTAAAPPPKWIVRMVYHDALFENAKGPEVLGDSPFVPGAWAWLALAVFGPLAAWAGLAGWRRINPDAARQALIRRSRAARRALETIARANASPDPAATIANALLHYLRQRFPLPAGADTPSEIEAGLRAANVSEVDALATAEFFRMCDAARFAPESDNALSLRTAAERLIARLEAVQ